MVNMKFICGECSYSVIIKTSKVTTTVYVQHTQKELLQGFYFKNLNRRQKTLNRTNKMNEYDENYNDNEDAHLSEHHGHKIVPRDNTDVHSLILPPNRCTKRCLNTCDVCLSLVVISPLVIIHWRGTWAIMDENMDYFPPLNCFILGMIFHLVIAMVREFLYSEYKKTKMRKRTWIRVMSRSVLTKLYAYIFSWSCQMHWRGGWAVIDRYFGIGLHQALCEMGFCLFFLLCFKSLRNAYNNPYGYKRIRLWVSDSLQNR
ncbi:hypothetical protein Bhyg_01629, partial [Pseudolycoriella hygida]